MGIKRPLEAEDFPETSFKQPKQLDYNKTPTVNTEESQITTVRVDSPGGAKNNFCKLQFNERLEDGETNNASVVDKEFEASAPLSLITSSSSEEDAGNGNTSIWSYFPGYIDFSIPRRPPEQFEDPYIYLLNCSPRKEVPVGPDHQAEVPLWSPNGNDSPDSNHFADKDTEQKLIGNCIVPMPDLNDSTIDGIRIGRGRTDCNCLDVGSMRCIQQHVKEAREKLRETIGDEIFLELGFDNMGDEVACNWTPEDEHLFHEVVFSNPVSHGKKFWKHLRAAFPARTKKELVSYYFNVFMLRRRAVQNRSYLEIDSDDDEERKSVNGDFYQNGSRPLDQDIDDHDDHRQGRDGNCYLARREEEDSTVESFGDEDLDWVDDFWSEPGNVGGQNNGITSECNGEKQDGLSEQETKKLHDGNSFDS